MTRGGVKKKLKTVHLSSTSPRKGKRFCYFMACNIIPPLPVSILGCKELLSANNRIIIPNSFTKFLLKKVSEIRGVKTYLTKSTNIYYAVNNDEIIVEILKSSIKFNLQYEDVVMRFNTR